MSRKVIDPPAKDKTTIQASKLLLDRIGIHCRKSGEYQNDFVERALVNQLEREGDLSIRSELEEENNG